jgi:hypothetical protein
MILRKLTGGALGMVPSMNGTILKGLIWPSLRSIFRVYIYQAIDHKLGNSLTFAISTLIGARCSVSAAFSAGKNHGGAASQIIVRHQFVQKNEKRTACRMGKY